MNDIAKAFAKVQAIQEIEYLRRWYARATDLIGIATTESIEEGRQIYHRIFTTDVEFDVRGTDRHPLPANGPDVWVDVVHGALAPKGPTQHLIGTQLVTIDQLLVADDGSVKSGNAKMQSYLQAWHELADQKVWLYLGIYHDQVTFTSGIGWQISHMRMEQVAGETRYMGDAVGKA